MKILKIILITLFCFIISAQKTFSMQNNGEEKLRMFLQKSPVNVLFFIGNVLGYNKNLDKFKADWVAEFNLSGRSELDQLDLQIKKCKLMSPENLGKYLKSLGCNLDPIHHVPGFINNLNDKYPIFYLAIGEFTRTDTGSRSSDLCSKWIDVLHYAGANINAAVNLEKKDFGVEGWTTIFLAPNTHILEKMIKFGANINWQNGDGETPLHVAVIDGRLDLVKKLIELGADLTLISKDDFLGGTPLQTAQTMKKINSYAKEFDSIIDLLKQEESKKKPSQPKNELWSKTETTFAAIRLLTIIANQKFKYSEKKSDLSGKIIGVSANTSRILNEGSYLYNSYLKKDLNWSSVASIYWIIQDIVSSIEQILAKKESSENTPGTQEELSNFSKEFNYFFLCIEGSATIARGLNHNDTIKTSNNINFCQNCSILISITRLLCEAIESKKESLHFKLILLKAAGLSTLLLLDLINPFNLNFDIK